jgi:glycosyl transferase family 25
MRVAVINLDLEGARWIAVREQLWRTGLQPERFSAIRGASLSPDQRARLYCEKLNRSQYHKPLKPGEIGCYASHLSVWAKLLRSPDACLAVFEDDIEVDPDLPHVLAAIERLPRAWDMVKLVGRSREKVQRHSPLLPGHDLIDYRRVPSLTGAYVIHRRGAAKLLAARVPFGRPVDVDLRHWWECELEVLGVQPYPVHEAPSGLRSTIEERRVPVDASMRVRKLMFQARYTMRNWHAMHLAPNAMGPRVPMPSRAGSPAGHDVA